MTLLAVVLQGLAWGVVGRGRGGRNDGEIGNRCDFLGGSLLGNSAFGEFLPRTQGIGVFVGPLNLFTGGYRH